MDHSQYPAGTFSGNNVEPAQDKMLSWIDVGFQIIFFQGQVVHLLCLVYSWSVDTNFHCEYLSILTVQLSLFISTKKCPYARFALTLQVEQTMMFFIALILLFSITDPLSNH